MAFLKQPSNLKISILNFVKNIVSKTLFRAFEILLNPCCDLSISDIDITCTDTDVATVTLTLGKGFSFPKTGTFTLTSDLDGLVAQGDYSGESTLVIEDAVVATAGAAVYTLTLFLPTTTDQGVYLKANISTTNPNCT